MEEILTPEDVKELYANHNAKKIAEFNQCIKNAIESGQDDIRLSFENWGCNNNDIKFIRNAGWIVNRNAVFSRWEINIHNIVK